MREETSSPHRPRFARHRVIALEEASPELLEAEPSTTIRLSLGQAEQLADLERRRGGRFRRATIADVEARPVARS